MTIRTPHSERAGADVPLDEAAAGNLSGQRSHCVHAAESPWNLTIRSQP